MSPAPDANGYLRTMILLGGRPRTVKIHRLVAFVWMGEPPEGRTEINHKNGERADNRPCNLEWVTREENMRHAFSAGLCHNRGEMNPLSKLTAEAVREIRTRHRPRIYTRKMLAEDYGVTESAIKDVLAGKTWSHVK